MEMQIVVASAEGLIESYGAWVQQSPDGQNWTSISSAVLEFGGVGAYTIPVPGVAGQYVRLAVSLSNSLDVEGPAVAVLSARLHVAVP